MLTSTLERQMRCSFALPFCALLLLCPGCALDSGPGAHAGESYAVNAQRTLFYSFGPAQATGPDYALFRGERLTMLSYTYGYSHVVIVSNGQSGYVPTEDIVPAPPIPSPSPGPSGGSGSSRHRHALAPLRLHLGNPEVPGTIPLPDFPETQPPPDSPKFRY